MPSLDADVGVLENHRSVRGHAETLGGLQENFGIRLSMHDIFRGDDLEKGMPQFRRWVDDATAQGTPASRSR